MSAAERLSAAFNSSDLGASPLVLKDVDYLIALGHVGIHSRVASALLRLHYGLRAADYETALDEVERLVWRLSNRLNWRIHDKRREAKSALDFVLCPVCPACLGRKYETEPGTPMLSDRPCMLCGGSGLRSFNSRFLPDICAEIDRLEAVALGGVWKRTAQHLVPGD